MFRNQQWVAAALVAVVYAIVSYLYPYQLDDLMYIGWLHDAGNSFVAFAGEHWSVQNGRLGNLLCPLLLCGLPKPVFAAFIGLSVAGLLFGSARLSRCGSGSDWRRFALFWLVFALALPWHDNIMVADFALNYVLSGLLNVLFLLAVTGNWRAAVWWLPAFAAGWSHEGVSLPMLAGLAVLFAIGRLKLTRGRLLCVTAYLAGCLIAVTSPGLWGRAAGSVSLDSVNPVGLIRTAVLTFPAACVLFGALGVCLVSKRWRNKVAEAMADNVVLLTGVVVAASYVLVVATGASFRGAFFAELLCVVSFFRVFIRRVGRSAAVGSLLLLGVFYCGVIYWQGVFFRQSRTIHRLISDGEAVCFVPLREYAPWYTLGNVAESEWRNPIQYMALNGTVGPVMVLPEELADFSADKAQAVDGNCGAVCYRGYYLVPMSDKIRQMAESQPYGGNCLHAGFRVTSASGRSYGVYASLRGFRAGNGQRWFLISPDRGYWRSAYRHLFLYFDVGAVVE